ncbi:MAG: GDSL-type esterase/lipase family protein [Myxococcota bacterium]|jgi:lysophospholipase L1-like esterase|nr:GDSL-type esterase/lipase family protein [Myxococcota bacterium]
MAIDSTPAPRPRTPGRQIARVISRTLALTLLALLVALETVPRISPRAARWFEPDDRLGDVLRLLERHPERWWRLRAGLATTFAGASVRTGELHLRGAPSAGPPAADRLRVLCLGESLTFGWGVEEDQAYPSVLQDLLGEVPLDGRRAEVINGGTPGYSSHQGLAFLREVGLELEPDLVTIPYAVNDLDRLRFFRNDGRPDSALTPGSALGARVLNAAATSPTVLLTRRLLAGALKGAAVARLEARALAAGDQARVPPDDYEANLRELVGICRERGIAVVLVVVPLHLPLRAVDDPPLELAGPLAELAAAGVGTGPSDAELAQLQDWVDEQLASALDAALAAPAEQARERVDRARHWDAWRCRLACLGYNRVMRRLAAELGTPCTDVAAAVAAHPDAASLFRGEHADPIHPSPAGHALFARAIATTIDGSSSTASGADPPPAVP